MGVEILHQFSEEGEIEFLLKTAVEVVFWHEILERDVFGEWLEVALLRPHHSGASCHNRPAEQYYRSSGPNIQSLAGEGTRISTGCRALGTWVNKPPDRVSWIVKSKNPKSPARATPHTKQLC